ncbi:hypothetical protein CapIbe_003685 [Capra ibex]
MENVVNGDQCALKVPSSLDVFLRSHPLFHKHDDTLHVKNKVCTAEEARSARKQMLLPRQRRRLPAPGRSNCHTVPELNLKRE